MRANLSSIKSSDASSKRGFQLSLQPATAWTAILVLSIFTALLIIAGGGKILNLVFPAGSLVVGIFLYFRAPLLYMGFSWWLWFLTPLVRRLADYRSGFNDPSPILLAPYLVSLITIITFWQYLPKIHQLGGLPFLLSTTGVFYGFLIGLINKPGFPVARDCLDWLTPIFLGFYLFVNWRDYPHYRQNIQRVFIWGVLVTGIYAIFQYRKIPEWDLFWVNNVGMNSVFVGSSDEAGSIRMFSTMQSTEVFAAFISASLLFLLTSPGVLSLSASLVGYFALLFTFVRSAWLGWLVGFLTLVTSLTAKFQMRLILFVLILAVCILPLATTEKIFSEQLNERFASLSNIQEDGSAKGRSENFRESIGTALFTIVGEGLGGSGFDNNLLAILFKLGWIGSILYVSGLASLIFRIFQLSGNSFDPFIGAARAVVISALVRIPVNGSLLGISGLLLWGFFGLAIAGSNYYKRILKN